MKRHRYNYIMTKDQIIHDCYGIIYEADNITRVASKLIKLIESDNLSEEEKAKLKRALREHTLGLIGVVHRHSKLPIKPA